MLNDKENFNKLYFKYSIMNYKKKLKIITLLHFWLNTNILVGY